jgi:hypothetical protein
MDTAPNPEAIAWYLGRSESLLADLRERVQFLRTRGVQIAGFSGAVLALAGANVASILATLRGPPRDCAGLALLIGVLLLVVSLVTALRGTTLVLEVSIGEVANYTSERFICEPEPWRVHLRTIHGLVEATESVTAQGEKVARAVRNAEYSFIAGLFSVGLALAILIVTVTV